MKKEFYSDEILFRLAVQEDLPVIIEMLADDSLGSNREDPSLPIAQGYISAFEKIKSDQDNELFVAVADGKVIGVLQITFIPYLTYKGRWRALIEGVRISRAYRSQGVGRSLLEWAITRARDRSCILVQLTTDKLRSDSIRFYENLGFIASHEGMKLNCNYL